jgi:chromosome partitioning protein
MIKIAITNQKGGVAKTTTAINVSACLAKLKKKVLLVDLDPQASLTDYFGIDTEGIKDIYDVLTNKSTWNEVLIKKDNLDVIPSSIEWAEDSLKQDPYLLTKAFISLSAYYDYVIIDCPPHLGLLNLNALLFSDYIIIPIKSQLAPLKSLNKLFKTISEVKTGFNKDVKILGYLLTEYDQRTNLSREIKEILSNNFKDQIFKTEIRNNISIAEAYSFNKSVIDYMPKSNGAIDYMNLTKEIIKRLK